MGLRILNGLDKENGRIGEKKQKLRVKPRRRTVKLSDKRKIKEKETKKM